jgi:hypothetical protein
MSIHCRLCATDFPIRVQKLALGIVRKNVNVDYFRNAIRRPFLLLALLAVDLLGIFLSWHPAKQWWGIVLCLISLCVWLLINLVMSLPTACSLRRNEAALIRVAPLGKSSKAKIVAAVLVVVFYVGVLSAVTILGFDKSVYTNAIFGLSHVILLFILAWLQLPMPWAIRSIRAMLKKPHAEMPIASHLCIVSVRGHSDAAGAAFQTTGRYEGEGVVYHARIHGLAYGSMLNQNFTNFLDILHRKGISFAKLADNTGLKYSGSKRRKDFFSSGLSTMS